MVKNFSCSKTIAFGKLTSCNSAPKLSCNSPAMKLTEFTECLTGLRRVISEISTPHTKPHVKAKPYRAVQFCSGFKPSSLLFRPPSAGAHAEPKAFVSEGLTHFNRKRVRLQLYGYEAGSQRRAGYLRPYLSDGQNSVHLALDAKLGVSHFNVLLALQGFVLSMRSCELLVALLSVPHRVTELSAENSEVPLFNVPIALQVFDSHVLLLTYKRVLTVAYLASLGQRSSLSQFQYFGADPARICLCVEHSFM